jgi:hypothetical protein
MATAGGYRQYHRHSQSVNDSPVAVDDNAVTSECSVGLAVLTMTACGRRYAHYRQCDTAANGNVVNNGSDVTAPNPNFNGADVFSYTAADGHGGADTATVMVTVNPVNDAPTIVNPGDQVNIAGDTVSLLMFAEDLDGDLLTFSATSLPAGLSIDPATGSIGGSIAAGAASASYHVVVTVTDPGGFAANTAFNWTVSPGTVQPLVIAIDVKPGETPNCINNDGHGVIPVAIWGGASFDTSQIDLYTITLEGQGVRIPGKNGNIQAHFEDANGDGFIDLIVQIQDVAGSLPEGEAMVTLTARLFDGRTVVGSDSLCIVP